MERPATTGTAPVHAFLFFVDLEPEVNWAHPCACVFVSEAKETLLQEGSALSTTAPDAATDSCGGAMLGTALFGAPADAPQPGPARRPLSLLDAFYWARAQDRRQMPPTQESSMIFDPGGLAGGIYL